MKTETKQGPSSPCCQDSSWRRCTSGQFSASRPIPTPALQNLSVDEPSETLVAPTLLALLCRLNTMVALMHVPPGASMPALLQLMAGAQEFSGICLRRSEKKVLNAINRNAECVRYHVEEPSKPGKATARIKTAAEKIFILVRDAPPGFCTEILSSGLL